MTEEIWKDVSGYEGLYQVSNLGRIKSLDRIVPWKNGKPHHLHGKIISQRDNGNGYVQATLWKQNRQFITYVHRLVALAFLPNQNGLPEVNHKDENPLNNQSDNLEWCEHKYNIKYGTRTAKVTKKRNKAVVQFDQTGKRVGEYCSASDIEKVFGFSQGHISDCCNGKRKSAYGYVWQYK